MAEVVTEKLKMLANLMARYRTLRRVRSLSLVTPNPVWLAARRELLMTQVRAQCRAKVVTEETVITVGQRWANVKISIKSFSAAGVEIMAARTLVTAMVAVVLFIGTGIGLVRAADGAIPGNALYSVKLATESLRLRVATSPQRRVALQTEFASRRLSELTTLTARGSATLPRTEALVGEFENNIQGAVAMVTNVSNDSPENASAVANQVNDQLNKYEQDLKSANTTNNDNSKTVDRALAAVSRASTAALKVIAGHTTKNSQDAPVVASKISDKIKQTEDILQLADKKLAVALGGAKVKATTPAEKEAKAETTDAMGKSAVAKTNLAEAKRKVKEGDYQAALNILETVQDMVAEVTVTAEAVVTPPDSNVNADKTNTDTQPSTDEKP